MTATAPDAERRRIELSRAQQWTLHDVMLDRCQAAREEDRTPPWWAVDAVEKVESGRTDFTSFEARRIRSDLREYARDEATPDREAEAARGILAELSRTFGGPPATPDQ